MVLSRRAIVLSLVAMAVSGAGLTFGAGGFRRGSSPPYDRPAPRMAAPTARDRVLIVAPHPDDESVGCGGLIASAVAAGAAVQVVYITNGDAFRTAAQKLFSEKSVRSEDYLKLAQMRQREALSALAKLGVTKKNAIFLGYPDRGIDRLWLQNWEVSAPYTSHYTKTNHSPYAGSFRPNAPYAGRALLDDLEAVVRSFKPTLVVAPHPRDIHGDHWSSYCFTVAALYELKLLDSVKLWLYLAHTQNKWFSPSGGLMDPTAAPATPDETKTQWYTFPLTADEVRRKREAIAEHSTQLLIMKDWLMNFARRRELYGQVAIGLLQTGLGSTPPKQQRTGGKRVTAEASIVAMRASVVPPGMRVRLDLVRQPWAKVQYQVHMHVLSNGRAGPPETRVIQPAKTRRSVEVALPAPHDDADVVMFAADAWRGGKQVDRTSWVVAKRP